MIPSAAYGLSVAARNVPLHAKQAVLLLEGQFPSNLLPWRMRCAEVGASLVFAKRRADQDWTSAVLDALDAHPDVAVLALPQAHWRDGSVLDLARISERARARGASLVLDLSQSLGAMPVDLDAWQPDFVIAVGYKWLLGGYGLAWLWAAPRWRDHGQPLEHGWMANDRDALWHADSRGEVVPLAGARRFDADGVCDAMRLAMAEAALRQVLAWGVADIATHLQRRTAGAGCCAGTAWVECTSHASSRATFLWRASPSTACRSGEACPVRSAHRQHHSQQLPTDRAAPACRHHRDGAPDRGHCRDALKQQTSDAASLRKRAGDMPNRTGQ